MNQDIVGPVLIVATDTMDNPSPKVLEVGKTASPEPQFCQTLCHILSQVHHVWVLQELHVLDQATLVPPCKVLRVEWTGSRVQSLNQTIVLTLHMSSLSIHATCQLYVQKYHILP